MVQAMNKGFKLLAVLLLLVGVGAILLSQRNQILKPMLEKRLSAVFKEPIKVENIASYLNKKRQLTIKLQGQALQSRFIGNIMVNPFTMQVDDHMIQLYKVSLQQLNPLLVSNGVQFEEGQADIVSQGAWNSEQLDVKLNITAHGVKIDRQKSRKPLPFNATMVEQASRTIGVPLTASITGTSDNPQIILGTQNAPALQMMNQLMQSLGNMFQKTNRKPPSE